MARQFVIFLAFQMAFVMCRVFDMTDNFDQMISHHDTVLVKFFAPWCGHCKKLAPVYEQASSLITAGTLAEVDCTTDKGKLVCQNYDIKGYPSLKLFRNGEEVSEYQGRRETDAIVSYMHEQTVPPITEITTVDEMKSFLDDKTTLKGVLVGYFKNVADSKHFVEFADKKHSVRFAYSTSPEVTKELENKLIYYMPAAIRSGKLEPSEILFTGQMDSAEEIQKFIADNMHGLCTIRTEENREKFDVHPHLVVYLNTDLTRNAQVKAAKVLKDDHPSISFAISDASAFEYELEKAGLQSSKSSKHTLFYDSKGQRYVMETPFGSDSIVEFVTNVVNGKIEPSLKSEPLPTDSLEDHVHVIVAKNFKNVITDSGKDVFIEFYAPWCGHCKTLAPVLAQVAKDLSASSDNLIIAKMNAIDNDVPTEYTVEGFPTMYFIPKGSNEPEKYNGGRKAEDFIKFLAEKSTEPLKGYGRDGKRLETKEL